MNDATGRRDPFDAHAALLELRPRLAAARSGRRRRVMTGSVLSVALLVGGIGLASLPGDSGPEAVAVVASSDDALLPDGSTATTAPTDGSGSDAADPSATIPPEPSDDTTPPPADPPPVLAPAAPPPVPLPPHAPPAPPAPPAPDPGPAAVQHTVSYDGAGSIVVEQRGDDVSLVSTAPAPGWAATPHPGPDHVKVEFTKDGVHRWLKVRVHHGQLKVERWEHEDAPSCTLPVGTTTHDVPRGAGQVTVSVTAEGKLTLDQISASAGWTGQVESQNRDTVKVKFRKDGAAHEHAWVKVMLRDCTIKVETGGS